MLEIRNRGAKQNHHLKCGFKLKGSLHESNRTEKTEIQSAKRGRVGLHLRPRTDQASLVRTGSWKLIRAVLGD